MPLASTYNPTFRPPSHWCAFSVYSFYIFKEDSRKTSFTFDSSDWILDLAHSRQLLYTCATTSALHIWIHINEHILPMVEKGFFLCSLESVTLLLLLPEHIGLQEFATIPGNLVSFISSFRVIQNLMTVIRIYRLHIGLLVNCQSVGLNLSRALELLRLPRIFFSFLLVFNLVVCSLFSIRLLVSSVLIFNVK